jgi:hypothetical protein
MRMCGGLREKDTPQPLDEVGIAQTGWICLPKVRGGPRSLISC